MVAKFSIYSWRDIIRICAPMARSPQADRDALQYLYFWFDHTDCMVYGANSVQVSRIQVPFTSTDVHYGVNLLVEPVKPTSHTQNVELHIDLDKKEYTIIFLDSEDEILDGVTRPFASCEPLNYPLLYERAQQNFDLLSVDGSGRYYICVDPKILLRSLEGFKGCEKVIFNFGGRNQPFTIRPYGDDDLNAMALVNPVRML